MHSSCDDLMMHLQVVLAKACGENTIVRDLAQRQALELPLDAAVFAEQKKIEELEAGAARFLEEGDIADENGGGEGGHAAYEFFRDKNIMEKQFDDHNYFTYVHRMITEAGDKFKDEITAIDKKHDNFWHRLQTKWDAVVKEVRINSFAHACA